MNNLNSVLFEGRCDVRRDPAHSVLRDDYAQVVCTRLAKDAEGVMTEEVTRVTIVPASPKVRLPHAGQWVRVVGRLRWDAAQEQHVIVAEHVELRPTPADAEPFQVPTPEERSRELLTRTGLKPGEWVEWKPAEGTVERGRVLSGETTDEGTVLYVVPWTLANREPLTYERAMEEAVTVMASQVRPVADEWPGPVSAK